MQTNDERAAPLCLKDTSRNRLRSKSRTFALNAWGMRYTPTRAGSRRPLITKTNRRRGRNSRAIKTERERRVDLSQIVSLAPTHELLILFSLSFPGREGGLRHLGAPTEATDARCNYPLGAFHGP